MQSFIVILEPAEAKTPEINPTNAVNATTPADPTNPEAVAPVATAPGTATTTIAGTAPITAATPGAADGATPMAVATPTPAPIPVPIVTGGVPTLDDPNHWSKDEKYDAEACLEAPYKKHLGRHANK